MNKEVIYGPRAVQLRDPKAEQDFIGFVLDVGETDMMRWDAIQRLVQDWMDEGGQIATASGRLLDMERAEYTGEATAYDTEGQPVFLESNVPLVRIEDSCGASPRRFVNHLLAKNGQVSVRRVSVEHLSRYFWIAVAMRIFDANFS